MSTIRVLKVAGWLLFQAAILSQGVGFQVSGKRKIEGKT